MITNDVMNGECLTTVTLKSTTVSIDGQLNSGHGYSGRIGRNYIQSFYFVLDRLTRNCFNSGLNVMIN